MNSLLLTKALPKKKQVKYNNNDKKESINPLTNGNFRPVSNLKTSMITEKDLNLNNNHDKNTNFVPNQITFELFNAPTLNLNNLPKTNEISLELFNFSNNEEKNNQTKQNLTLNISYIKEYLKKNIKTICNVFQPVYKNDEKTTGFGDFIRGCYYLMQFCEENGFFYNFLISNHKIKYLLKNFEKSPNLPIHISEIIKTDSYINFDPIVDSYQTIHNGCDYNTNNAFLNFLNDCPIFDNSAYVHLITYPNLSITQNQREKMQFLLQPSEIMIEKTNNALLKLGLPKYSYEIIHIRFGDEYITNGSITINKSKINQLFNYLNILDKTKRYLLLTDNNILKKILITKYNCLNTIFNEIAHTKDGDTNIASLKNTMLEFYLMSYSTNITSFSVYKHGSGFSKWCAETYDIPYICKYLN